MTTNTSPNYTTLGRVTMTCDSDPNLYGTITSTGAPYSCNYSSPLLNHSTTFNSYLGYYHFPVLIKTVEREESKEFLFAVPDCTKQNVDVTYIEQDSFFKVEAKHGELFTSAPCQIAVNTEKLDLSKIECYVKDGLLKVIIPYFEDALPKSVKIN